MPFSATRPAINLALSACISSLAVGSCSAQSNSDLSCSSAAATEVVESLFRDRLKDGANAMQSEFMDFDRTKIIVEAIRTVRSTSKVLFCRAAVRINVVFKSDQNGQAIGALFRGGTETTRESEYQVQLTDDGKIYVTIGASDNGDGSAVPSHEDDE